MSTESTRPQSGEPFQADARQRIEAAWQALQGVTDPEIPVINVVEMGIIADVRIDRGGCVVDMTPTFAACPALDVIRAGIQEAVEQAGEVSVTVNVVYDPPWNSDRISEAGRRKLKTFGLAPPGKSCAGDSRLPDLEKIPCPYCDSSNTELESMFGPTLCRSIHYCHACLQSFEHFKTV
ncbi:MAG: 1,2-phenylacetyl-CoA epoxidase subunit PaaD [Phycisphaerae bacterium]